MTTIQDDLTEALAALETLTDATFLLYHQVLKGYRTHNEERIVKWALEDSIALLQQHGRSADVCPSCGSAHPDSSPWHQTHCAKEIP